MNPGRGSPRVYLIWPAAAQLIALPPEEG